MKYDLRLKSEDLTLTDKDGNDKDFVLYEATGTQRDLQEKFVYSLQDKKGKVEDMRGIKEHFLGMLLRDKTSDAPVGSEFFIGMPGRIRNQLFDIAQQLSGMKSESEILKILYERELQKAEEKLACEEAGEEYIDPDEEAQKQMEEEIASGKE